MVLELFLHSCCRVVGSEGCGLGTEAQGKGRRTQQGFRANPQVLSGFCHGSRNSFLVSLIYTRKLLMWQRTGEEENILGSLFKSIVIKGFIFFY